MYILIFLLSQDTDPLSSKEFQQSEIREPDSVVAAWPPTAQSLRLGCGAAPPTPAPAQTELSGPGHVVRVLSSRQLRPFSVPVT